ncbi:MAG: Glu/Leu/Phe/Val dehydrogenase [Candidatus Aenigmatarchaeota archaeon]|nr:MAG: Glu/Leu/Phe/Val dehydrogenase [Candidatus Aenigmarchaeota archaeon]
MNGIAYDGFGPERIYDIYNPKLGLRGFVVLDNLALGVAKGGIRMTPTVSVEEVSKLARTMTWKNAMAELPFGGGKAGIQMPVGMTPQKKEALIRAFGEAIKPICPSMYVAGPDINTTEREMGQLAEAVGTPRACTGKPREMGGIPHELGSTGFGVFHALRVAAKDMRLDLKGATIAIEGFGNVGWFVAKFAAEAGAKLVAVSDSKGVAYLKGGMDFARLADIKKTKGTVTAYPKCKTLPAQNIVGADVDILVTAAIPDLINKKNAGKVKAKLIVEGSNIPMTYETELALFKRGVLFVPDFVANAGGVISSYIEYIGGTDKEMFRRVENTIVKNAKLVLDDAHELRIDPRAAALRIAKERVIAKCRTCAPEGLDREWKTYKGGGKSEKATNAWSDWR